MPDGIPLVWREVWLSAGSSQDQSNVLASCELRNAHRIARSSTATSTTMRPDFWLARTHDDRYSLTPCSPLGKREYPDIQIGVSLGSFRMLTSDEAEFLVEVWGLHFKVNDRTTTRPAANAMNQLKSSTPGTCRPRRCHHNQAKCLRARQDQSG